MFNELNEVVVSELLLDPVSKIQIECAPKNVTFGDTVHCVCVHVTQSTVQGEKLEAVLTSFCVITYRESS